MFVIAIVLIGCATGITICYGSEIVRAISDYKTKKLLEDHRTTNLAVVYQILSVRPELSLEEVIRIVENGGSQNDIPQNNVQSIEESKEISEER